MGVPLERLASVDAYDDGVDSPRDGKMCGWRGDGERQSFARFYNMCTAHVRVSKCKSNFGDFSKIRKQEIGTEQLKI